MAEQTIDQLNIEINTKAKQSSSGMDKLIASIEKLRNVTGGGIGTLTGIAGSLSKLDSAVSSLKSKSGIVSSIVNSLSKLNDLKTDRVTGNLNTVTESLKSLGGMSPEIKELVNSLGTLAKSGNGGVAQNALSLQASAAKAQATIDKSALTSAKAQEGLTSIVEKNKQIEESARQAAAQEKEMMDSVNSAVARFNAQKNASSTAPVVWNRTTTRLPSGTATSIDSLKAAINGTGGAAFNSMNQVSSGSSKATGFVNRLKSAFNSAKESVSGFGSSAQSAFRLQSFYGVYFILKRVASTIGGFISNINSYIENMNLFDVAMGSAAQSGEKLAQSLQDVLGVDSGEAMRYMGVFQQIDTSFGVTNKQATIMSDNLTQLGYDIASFYNISTATSFEKLESGITGQSRALRQLGIDTSSTRLQQELYNLGIKANVNDLSQADKAELRYIAIMKQTTNAQGDMARTIQTPANALRILTAQLQVAGRAIGSIFIPALEMILPPAIAVVEVIGGLASELASLAGFTMPKIDYSSLKDVSSGADDAATSVGNIGKNAKDSKKQLDNLISGFDELNILNTSSTDASTGAGVGSGAGGSVLDGIDLPSYNALSGAISNNIDALKKKIKEFLDAFKEDPLKTFSDALWGVNGAFDDLDKWLSSLDYADVLEGISAALIGFGLTKNPILALAIGAVTMALTHLLPQKSKIDVLNGTLATLGIALMLKTFTGMNFSLAMGISTLLTSGLIELIGKKNAINLLASSLTGLGAGLMVFTFTGNLPLAVAMGAATGAISGLSIYFTDLRIAPGLLAGVSTALLAFKWGGFSQGAAGLVGIGAAITSFAELNKISPELRTGLLGLAGAIEGVGLAIKLGFGPEGMIITAAAGAIIGLGVAIYQASQDAKKADLEKRFGSIALSAKDVEDVAERITTTPWTVKIDAAIDAADKVKTFESTLKTEIETLNKLDWKVSVGIKLTKDEQSTYKETIKSFINDTKSYVQSQQYAVTLAINAILEPGSATAKNLTQFTNKYYSDTQAELDKLGTQLSNEVNKSFQDNVLSEGEIIKIQEIQKKMNDLLQKIADQKYKATLKSLEMDTKGTEITADSFKDLQTKIQSNITDQLKQAEQAKTTVFQQIDLQYETNEKNNVANAEQIRDKAYQDAQEAFNNKKATLELSGIDVSLNTLKSKFKTELAGAQTVFASGVKEAYSNGFSLGLSNPEEMYKAPMWKLMNSLKGSYQVEFNNLHLSQAAKDNMKELVSQLQPTEDDLRQIADANKKAGLAVPANLAKGISDMEQMKAISGSLDAQQYMIGQKLSTDSKFLETLATAKNAGKDIDSNVAQGLTDNLQFIKDSASGTIIGIKDTVTGKVTEITPTLKQNLSDLGVNMSNSLVSGVNSKKADATTSGENVVQGVWDGMKKKKKEMDPWVVTASKNPIEEFNKQNEIHSPSKLFERSGEYLIQGLWNGMKSTWSKFTSWWENLKLKVPHFEFGMESLNKYDNAVANAAKTLGLKEIPTVDVKWCAKGGVFDSTSVIGVGEYSGARSNPEIVTPQSIMKKTVEEVNRELIAKINADSESNTGKEERLIEMMRLAFLSALKESDSDINLSVNNNMDGETISRKIYKIQKRQERRYSPVG